MGRNLIGYKNISELQRGEFEENTKQKRRKILFWVMLLFPVLMVAAFQIAVFFAELPGGRLGALTIAIILTVFFEIWAVIKAIKERSQKDFEGEVIKKKTKKLDSGTPDNVLGYFDIRYRNTVVFKTTRGKRIKKHWAPGEKDPSLQTWYGYLNIGDKVRFHAKMDYYEKYDKSGDSEIPCAKCVKFVDITLDNCPECGAPLIKP